MPVAVEAPRAAVLHDFKPRLVMAVEQLIGNATGWPLVGQLQSRGAKPSYADHSHDLVWQNAAHGGGWQEVFEAGHFLRGRTLGFTKKLSPAPARFANLAFKPRKSGPNQPDFLITVAFIARAGSGNPFSASRPPAQRRACCDMLRPQRRHDICSEVDGCQHRRTVTT
jgi:hypothetical protein